MSPSFIVPGPPVPQGRPRFARVGDGVRTYTPAKTTAHMDLIRLKFHERYGNEPLPLYGRSVPVALSLVFILPRPKSHFGTGRNALKLKDSYEGAMHITKPDLDNLVKLVKDSLTGFAWEDDAQVVETSASKHYSRPSDPYPVTLILVHDGPDGAL